MANAYDEVRYPSQSQHYTHPAKMSALACLFDRPFAPPGNCRVLEIGCGDGTNLMSMAATAPQSQFVGFDLSEAATAAGRAAAAAAGLDNVELSVMNILDAPDSLGEFDYVIAHGVYAWVPAEVREALMRLIGRVLAPSGLAFVSYNAMPGCRIRQMVRDILRECLRDITDIGEKMSAAKQCLEMFTATWSEGDPVQNALRTEVSKTLLRPPEVLFHDEMGEIFEPQFVGHVAAHGKKHGLQYLCDCQPLLSNEGFFPSDEKKALRERAGDDWVRFEQLHDFATLLRFRETVFCRDDGPINRRADWTRLRKLHAQGRFVQAPAEEAKPGMFAFRIMSDMSLSTPDASLADLLTRIGAVDPGSIPLANELTGQEMGDAILRLFLVGSLSLQAEALPFTLTPGERPQVSGFARVQAARGDEYIASLRHTSVEVSGPEGRHFITLLDGTRTRRDLVTAMVDFTGMPEQAVEARMNIALDGLAKSALLTR